MTCENCKKCDKCSKSEFWNYGYCSAFMLAEYMDKSTGEIIDRTEMLKRFAEEYDGNDPTNAVPYTEYFEEI